MQDFSSSLDDTRQHAQYIDANHKEMCRFTDRSDPGYQQVSGELRLLVEKLEQERKRTISETRGLEKSTEEKSAEKTDSLSTEKRGG